MDGKPIGRKEAVFSYYSGVVLTLPHSKFSNYDQISKAVNEHKKLVETSGRLQRMVPDKDAFVENLFKARQAAHEVNTTQIDTLKAFFYFYVWNR